MHFLLPTKCLNKHLAYKVISYNTNNLTICLVVYLSLFLNLFWIVGWFNTRTGMSRPSFSLRSRTQMKKRQQKRGLKFAVPLITKKTNILPMLLYCYPKAMASCQYWKPLYKQKKRRTNKKHRKTFYKIYYLHVKNVHFSNYIKSQSTA